MIPLFMFQAVCTIMTMVLILVGPYKLNTMTCLPTHHLITIHQDGELSECKSLLKGPRSHEKTTRDLRHWIMIEVKSKAMNNFVPEVNNMPLVDTPVRACPQDNLSYKWSSMAQDPCLGSMGLVASRQRELAAGQEASGLGDAAGEGESAVAERRAAVAVAGVLGVFRVLRMLGVLRMFGVLRVRGLALVAGTSSSSRGSGLRQSVRSNL